MAFLLQYFMNVSKYQSLLKLYLILRLGHTLWILGFCFINIQLADCTCKRKSMHNCFKIQQNFDLKSIVEEPIMILDCLAGNYSNLTEPYIIYSGRIYLSWAEELVHITVRMILFIASRKNVFKSYKELLLRIKVVLLKLLIWKIKMNTESFKLYSMLQIVFFLLLFIR